MNSALVLKRTIPLALVLLAGTAAAQSSVTIFGTADAAVRYSDTERSGSITSLASGGYTSAKFGVRAQEDLGNGLSVSFWLESFLSMDTGAQTPAGWQRRSTLSFTSRDYGEIRMGRDYTPTHSNWARFDPFNYVGIASNQLLILSATGQTPVTAAFGTAPNDVQRANNGIAYILPKNDWNVEGALVRNFGEGGLAANDQHRGVGGRLGVTFGPVLVSGAMLNTKDSGTGNNEFKDSALAVLYTSPIGRFTVASRRLTYTTAKQDTYMVAGLIPFASVQEFKFSWVRSQMHGRVGATNIDANRTDQFGIGHVYHFSKRTRLYTTLATMKNEGNARFVIPTGPAATAGGLSSKGAEIGLNHDF